MREARALVLDTAHRALLLRAPDEALHTPATVARAGERPLVALVEFARERLGFDLPPPSGARPFPDPSDFVFVLPPDTRVDADSTLWVPMRELTDATPHADALWALYIDTMLGGWEPPTRAVDVFAFGREPHEQANRAHLVAKGAKRATTGWIDAERARGNIIPSPGLVSILTDGFGFPVCAIQTDRVDDVRFRDVGEDVARADGEGDLSLEGWRERQRRTYEGDAAKQDRRFGDDALVYVEHFRVLRVFARS
jgi:uncharacterized protein YhfF